MQHKGKTGRYSHFNIRQNNINPKTIRRDKEEITLIKQSVQQEKVTEVNLNAPNQVPGYFKRLLMDLETQIALQYQSRISIHHFHQLTDHLDRKPTQKPSILWT